MSQLLSDERVIARINGIIEDCAERLQEIVGGKVVISWKQKQGWAGDEIEALQNIICDVFELSWQKIKSKDRHRDLVAARQLFCFFSYRRIGKTLAAIGDILDRDHTTIIVSIRKVEDYVFTRDSQVYPMYKKVLKLFDEYTETKIEKAIA